MNLVPLNGRVIVTPKEKEEVSPGGIFIAPTVDKQRSFTGVVVAVASDVSDVLVGDMIYYGRYSGTDVEHDQSKLIIVAEKDILAVERA